MTPAATPSLAQPGRLDDSRLLPAGTRLDEFEIVRPLGVGGFGIVYLALDRSLLRQVALKEFMPGEFVRVKEGPFTDFNGTVEEVLADKGKVRVSVSLFGRPTSVELDYLQLKGY
jgi:transcription antitermination factor NusG